MRPPPPAVGLRDRRPASHKGGTGTVLPPLACTPRRGAPSCPHPPPTPPLPPPSSSARPFPPPQPTATLPSLSLPAMAPCRAVFVAAAATVAATAAANGASASWVSTALFHGGRAGPSLDLVAPRVPSSAAAAVAAAAAATTTMTTTMTTAAATASTPTVLVSAPVVVPAVPAAAAAAVMVAPARRSTPAWWTARQAVGGTAGAAPRSLYVNVGGGFVTFEGRTWVSDADPLGGGAPPGTRLFGKAPPGLPALLATNRYAQGVSMAFTRTVAAPSLYRLELLWAEIFMTSAGARFMDVFVSVDGHQPVEVMTAVDVWATVGGDALLRKSYPPVGSPPLPIESTVTITLQRSDLGAPGVSNVFLSAFSVVEEPTPTPTPAPTSTPSPADPARIGTILAAAAAAADRTTPAVRAAAGWSLSTRQAVAVAREERQRVTPLYEAAPRTDALTAAWAAYAAATTTFDDATLAYFAAVPTIDARQRMVTAALTAAREYAAGLSPPVCAFLRDPAAGGGASSPVTAAEIQALEGFAATLRAEVDALLAEVARVDALQAAVQAAADEQQAAAGNVRRALPLGALPL
ncbi:hypothetical protein I4F81_000120 [Pyropia yezoensis]|uniref:Uncharacterized protein n=1 Tax=Pyropia yezoensis TaxID=2788 RepID=A0ACC3BIP8_PYRYE|nr:hypothetical protein I4F81_000120 [Neopyropia yezoensis]